MAKSMYALYLSQDEQVKDTIFLGLSDNPARLYMDGLNPKLVHTDHISLIKKWLTLVESELDDVEKKDMDYAFMCNPLTEFSYPIKELTLYIKKIKVY